MEINQAITQAILSAITTTLLEIQSNGNENLRNEARKKFKRLVKLSLTQSLPDCSEEDIDSLLGATFAF